MAINKKLPDAARKSRRAARNAIAKAQAGLAKVPGPSPNPATNLLIADIAVRSAGRLIRRGAEKGLLQAHFAPQQASDIIEGRGLVRTLFSTAVARTATRSVPGALLVGGGLVAKTLFDRTVWRHKARRKGEETLMKQAENDPKL